MATIKTKSDFKVNKMDYKYTPKSKNWGDSVAVPDESMTVREMLHRHANGINFDNVKTPFYEEQATFSSQSIYELQKMDLTDKIQFLEEHAKQTNALKLKVKNYQDKLIKEAQENEVKATTTNQTTTTETE